MKFQEKNQQDNKKGGSEYDYEKYVEQCKHKIELGFDQKLYLLIKKMHVLFKMINTIKKLFFFHEFFENFYLKDKFTKP